MIPPAYRAATLADFGPSEIEGKQPDKGLNVVVFGAVGRGKTHYACALARAWGVRDVLFIKSKGIPALHQDRRSKDYRVVSDAECQLLYALKAPLLILDDLGAERRTDSTTSEILGVMDIRFEAGLPTIVTTNLELDEIQQKIDARVASRLQGFWGVRMLGGDRRKGMKGKMDESRSSAIDEHKAKWANDPRVLKWLARDKVDREMVFECQLAHPYAIRGGLYSFIDAKSPQDLFTYESRVVTIERNYEETLALAEKGNSDE